MFGLTALELARIQFGFTISAHIIFPATTIGLASYLAVPEGLWLWKTDTTYRDLCCEPPARRRCRVHRIPTRVRDDRETPLFPGGTSRAIALICPTG
jgi:Cytochrome bd terminal oxidase subunit I